MDAAPPSYALSTGLPTYAEAHAGPSIPSISIGTGGNSSLDEYTYRSGPLTLNMGPKRYGLARPSYGWNDVIEGFVHVKKNTRGVQSIIIRVEGEIGTGVSERGFLVQQSKTTILTLSETLFEASEDTKFPQEGAQYPFSFPLPTYVTGGREALPPSSALTHAGMAGNVTYYVWVEMIRKGKLRSNERLKAFFHYLPRTYAPMPIVPGPPTDDEKAPLGFQDDAWYSLEACQRSSDSGECSSLSDVRVSFALPLPLTYPSCQSLPFQLRIKSNCTADAMPLLLSSVSVQLVRVMVLTSGCHWTKKEIPIGGGEIFRVEERGDERVMFGAIVCPKAVGESSWQLYGIQVKHLVRMHLAPPSNLPGLISAIPSYHKDVPVLMRTHPSTHEGVPEDSSLPALCRLPRILLGNV